VITRPQFPPDIARSLHRTAIDEMQSHEKFREKLSRWLAAGVHYAARTVAFRESTFWNWPQAASDATEQDDI
jgi:hypothetical protein